MLMVTEYWVHQRGTSLQYRPCKLFSIQVACSSHIESLPKTRTETHMIHEQAQSIRSSKVLHSMKEESGKTYLHCNTNKKVLTVFVLNTILPISFDCTYLHQARRQKISFVWRTLLHTSSFWCVYCCRPVAGGPDALSLKRFELWKSGNLTDFALICSGKLLLTYVEV